MPPAAILAETAGGLPSNERQVIMHTSRASAQAAGRIGGLTRAATAPTPQAMTQAATDASWELFRQRVRDVMPEITDPADIDRRAKLLERAEMARRSAKGQRVRRLKRELARLEADLGTPHDAAAAELG